jgi:hypothetical protein
MQSPNLDIPPHDRWMPRQGERYFLILGNGMIQGFQWHGTDFDREAWSFGNCFRLRRQATQARDGMKEYLATFHREHEK